MQDTVGLSSDVDHYHNDTDVDDDHRYIYIVALHSLFRTMWLDAASDAPWNNTFSDATFASILFDASHIKKKEKGERMCNTPPSFLFSASYWHRGNLEGLYISYVKTFLPFTFLI